MPAGEGKAGTTPPPRTSWGPQDGHDPPRPPARRSPGRERRAPGRPVATHSAELVPLMAEPSGTGLSWMGMGFFFGMVARRMMQKKPAGSELEESGWPEAARAAARGTARSPFLQASGPAAAAGTPAELGALQLGWVRVPLKLEAGEESRRPSGPMAPPLARGHAWARAPPPPRMCAAHGF